MKPSLGKIIKYIRLEASRGYDDRAVLGGLERTLGPWQDEAQTEGVPPQAVQAVTRTFQGYASNDPQGRREALESLCQWLAANDVIPMQDPLPVPPSPPTPRAVDHEEPPGEAAAPSASDDTMTPIATGQASEAEEPASDEPDGAPPPPAETRRSAEKAKPAGPSLDEQAFRAPLTTISGIGPKSAKTLRKLGLETLGDLLYYFPRRYDDYSALKTINRVWYGEEVTVIGTVDEVQLRPVRGGRMTIVEAVVSDGTGAMRVSWFNQPWVAKSLPEGTAVVLSGKVDQYLGRLVMNSPEWETLERQQLHTNRIVPVYPLTAGISGKWLRRVMHSVVTRLATRVQDPLPASTRDRASLMALAPALQNIHFPEDTAHLQDARQRLAFDELFYLILGVLQQKREWESLQTDPLPISDDWSERFRQALPFELTPAQLRALQDVRADLETRRPMNRLLQGDVGSGKTVVAAYAIAIACQHQRQAAIMAPTSILAEQHYQTLLKILPAAGVPASSIRLLVGATPEAEKKEIRMGLADGSLLVAIGTHALLEDPIEFARLGLAVIDEQHRFGVEQRSALRGKGSSPNLLVMTATPIPRSLALTVYGDLDVSVIDELPPGRPPVETRLLMPVERSRAYQFIRAQIAAGRQAFVIYPLVESSEKVEALSAVEEHERLEKEIFPDLRLGLLHGRLKPEEKDRIMEQFRLGELDILVSTAVVEVGVDIPNASVILIEGANRFGLAQLHQFRGRVGRAAHASYCLLLADSDDTGSQQRLEALESTSDGFRLAELDLEQRGPGDFLGTRQSGFADLRLASVTDIQLVDKARRAAADLFQADPDLHLPENAGLASSLQRYWTTPGGEIS